MNGTQVNRKDVSEILSSILLYGFLRDPVRKERLREKNGTKLLYSFSSAFVPTQEGGRAGL